MRRLSVPFVEPLARVFNHPIRRSSIADTSEPESPSPEPENESSTAVPQYEHINESAPSAVPAISNPSPSNNQSDADLPLIIQDLLYTSQLTLSKPLLLSPLAFHTASIVWRYKDSQRVYKILQKKSIITPGGEIRTSAINKQFAHHFAYLSGFSQKRIVGLLFWWEEEEQRLAKLMEQEAEIKQLLKEMPPDEHGGQESTTTLLKTELTRTRMLISLKPSERAEIEMGEENEPLPAYSVSPFGSPDDEAIDPIDQRVAIPSH